jgi:ubiquinone/menaquinone biosynthesis C-methylase UbiE
MQRETYREFYDFEADQYLVTPESDPGLVHRRNLVRRLLPRNPGARVLEVGCGDGEMTAAITGADGAGVVALDLSRRRLERTAQRAPGTRLVQSSVYELPFADGSFDTVLCTDLLEHLDEPDLAVRELVRVASSRVLLSVPYSIRIERTLCPHCRKSYYLYGHQHSFGREGIQRLAEQAGARVLRFEHVIPMFECRRYRWLPPLKWLLWDHFKDTGTLGALLAKPGA